MRLRRWLFAALSVAIVAGSCSSGNRTEVDAEATGGPGDGAAPTTQPLERGVLYVHHAILGTSEREGDTDTITTTGVEQRTTWFSESGAGSVPTELFVTEELLELLMEGKSIQAAFVPSDPGIQPVLRDVKGVSWDSERRSIVYETMQATRPTPRLAELAPDPERHLPEEFQSIAVFVWHAEGVAGPTTTTTTTSTTTTTTTTTTTSTTTVPDGTSPSTTATPPTSSPPPPPPPPTTVAGPANIVATPLNVELPRGGGSAFVTVQNTGSGVGSWSATAPEQQGIFTSPSSGLLFPGGQATMEISYDGSQWPTDFSATVFILSPSGTVRIKVTVG